MAGLRAPGWSTYAHQRLAGTGFRRGGARTAVIDLLDGEACALSAIEIEDALRDGGRRVGRATVYRVLDELDGLGLITRLEIGDGLTRFETVFPDGTQHHHHLVCDGCGKLTPFTDDELERTIRRVARREAFAINDHDVTLHGSCENCMTSRTPSR
jgi:Fur family transcriptional regulator, ferric uptake regulator